VCTWAVGIAACASIAGVSPGQPETVIVDGYRWRPVEQGVGDRSPLSANRMLEPMDLRIPLNFDRVYKLDSEPRLFGGGPGPRYARMSGAVTAIFPRSEYTPAGAGRLLVGVPAGTVYSIGGPLEQILGPRWSAPRARVGAVNFVDRSAAVAPPAMSGQAGGDAGQYDDRLAMRAPDQGRSARGRTIWTSDALRQERLSVLLNPRVLR